jgi:hypothetical protein
MRFTKFFALAMGVAILVVWGANGQPPPGFGPKGGKGAKGAKGAKGQVTNSERLLDDLNLTDVKFDKAREIVRAHDERMRQAARQSRQELLAQLKDVLSETDFKTFKDELEQVPLLPSIPPILRTIATDDLIERLMQYDKNGDGKVTKDELPERMHSLIEQGDTNKDGALDREEIKRMAERAGPGGFPRGPNGGPPGRQPGGRP